MSEAFVESKAETSIGVKELLDAGMHFGHQSKRWNPKMKRFIFGKRNGIYIIDLTKTLLQLKEAQQFIYNTVAAGKSVLFVGTKKQSQDAIKETALRCGQHYINSRWLGGMLTNHQNIRVSIRRMQQIEEMEEKGLMDGMPQKEVSRLRHELARLQRFLIGLNKMSGMPGALVIIDVNREAIAVQEANRMGIPVVATVDTNCDPDPIAYPIPGNDDSVRAVRLVLNILAEAITDASAEYAATAALRQAEQAAKAEEQAARPAARGDDDTDGADGERGRRDRRPRRSGMSGGPRQGGRRAPTGNAPTAAAPAPAPTPAPAPADTQAG
ncbi:MAG: 30S ribosomal protein S2 [Kiritimatiellia bacterium]|nr:30S ribosomal protein S2 [Lentisphaerota bacterium]